MCALGEEGVRHSLCDGWHRHGGQIERCECPCHAAAVPPPEHREAPLSLHRCRICGTRWLLNVHGWNLLDKYQRPGSCCDNVAMGEQIEHLRDLQAEPPKLGSLSVAETQNLLGSDRPISIGKVPTDPIGMRATASIVRERLRASSPAAHAPTTGCAQTIFTATSAVPFTRASGDMTSLPPSPAAHAERPTAGDMLIEAVDKWATHAAACDAEPCDECDARFNQVRLAHKVWKSSAHQRAAISEPR